MRAPMNKMGGIGGFFLNCFAFQFMLRVKMYCIMEHFNVSRIIKCFGVLDRSMLAHFIGMCIFNVLHSTLFYHIKIYEIK